MALGLEQAGFKHVLLVENDKHACATLKANREHWNVYQGDVNTVDFTPYRGAVDLVSGGAPCQPFSYAGKRLGFGDVRGTLFSQFARCLEEVQPRLFLFENVKGLKTHDSGRTFATIKHTFANAGYSLYYQVLNAAFYGVAQRRQRLFIVGVRDDLHAPPFTFPEPDAHMLTLKQALLNVPASPGASYSKNRAAVLSLVPPGGNWRDLPSNIREEYAGNITGGSTGMARRLAWDEPCPTILTSPSQKRTDRCHPEETRPLTVRESARVQSFPDDWVLCGSISAQYRQIGNAVPVELARRLGVSLAATVRAIK